jgi:hypothetical protein
MILLGTLHPLMRNKGELLAPGPFAINYGILTVVALIGLHLVYGAWVGTLCSIKTPEEVHVSEEMPRAA